MTNGKRHRAKGQMVVAKTGTVANTNATRRTTTAKANKVYKWKFEIITKQWCSIHGKDKYNKKRTHRTRHKQTSYKNITAGGSKQSWMNAVGRCLKSMSNERERVCWRAGESIVNNRYFGCWLTAATGSKHAGLRQPMDAKQAIDFSVCMCVC